MLKIVGILLLFSSVALLGFAAASALRDRERYIGGLVSFWRQFAIQLDHLQATPRQITHRLAQQQEHRDHDFVQRLADGFTQGDSFQDALSQALERCPQLTAAEADGILRPLGEVIGRQQLESQLAAIALAVQQLEERHTVCKEETLRKGGLYRRLGLLGGGLLAILFF